MSRFQVFGLYVNSQCGTPPLYFKKNNVKNALRNDHAVSHDKLSYCSVSDGQLIADVFAPCPLIIHVWRVLIPSISTPFHKYFEDFSSSLKNFRALPI